MEEKNLDQELTQIKGLLKQNIEYSKKMLVLEEKNRKYILWIKIINLIKLVVILVPIVLAIIYFPPFIRDFLEEYRELFGPGGFFLNLLNG